MKSKFFHCQTVSIFVIFLLLVSASAQSAMVIENRTSHIEYFATRGITSGSFLKTHDKQNSFSQFLGGVVDKNLYPTTNATKIAGEYFTSQETTFNAKNVASKSTARVSSIAGSGVTTTAKSIFNLEFSVTETTQVVLTGQLFDEFLDADNSYASLFLTGKLREKDLAALRSILTISQRFPQILIIQTFLF